MWAVTFPGSPARRARVLTRSLRASGGIGVPSGVAEEVHQHEVAGLGRRHLRAFQYVTKWLMMRFITTRSFLPFVIHRVILGLLIFALIWFGALEPHAGESVH
uniref:Uncharacterized protein n=1 Tax=uncultured bacterium esnapd26 TaxID=1366607 RepID=S5TLS8_9BACT|nr:hypothetical protein [uncultured bacterium esnapd26]